MLCSVALIAVVHKVDNPGLLATVESRARHPLPVTVGRALTLLAPGLSRPSGMLQLAAPHTHARHHSVTQGYQLTATHLHNHLPHTVDHHCLTRHMIKALQTPRG